MSHKAIHDDPDLAQAIADLGPVAHELRQKEADHAALREGSAFAFRAMEVINDLYMRFDLRGQRLGMTGGGLRELVEAHLKDNPGNALVARYSASIADESEAAAIADQAAARLKSIRADRVFIEEAMRIHGARRTAA